MTDAPTDIRLHRRSRELSVTFASGLTVRIPCELLRIFSPSAEVRGHGPDDRKLITGKKYVNVESIDRVGNYAIRIVFDDGHDTGIYSWDYLLDLGERQADYWQQYETELKVANASRLPSIPLARAVGQWQPSKDES
ncbi:MAG: DUF971 domain-containing protein [Gammaproteobacteria bacterium]|nr:DUF971 domain-containing protein [Gammaproteobacteria bacterium]